MNMQLNQFRSLIIAVLLHTLATGAAADELTFQDLSNAWKIKTGMSETGVQTVVMKSNPAIELRFTENYSEWHYCQTVEGGPNEYLAVFFHKGGAYEDKKVLATKRYVVGTSNGLRRGPCELSTRLGSFSLPTSVKEKMDEGTLELVTGQWEFVLQRYFEELAAKEKARAVRESERIAAAEAAEKARAVRESERIAAAEAAEKLRESERIAAAEAAAEALAARRKRLLSLTSDDYPRWWEAQSIGRMREIDSTLPEGAVQIVQVNTTAMNELLEIIVLQNDMMIKLLQQQAEKE